MQVLWDVYPLILPWLSGLAMPGMACFQALLLISFIQGK
ncbi:putative membrane protein [Escherichia coli STEC_EH250]|nr:putative membrane protein [Escherichia coli STEC_EH250]EIH22175.1 hypothetical protein EC12264_4408 [Escherichia coli 1.2264]EIH44576.1 hypothetical protein EC970259_4928 [Escherichia coli 99.0741]EII23666.1 hypothetical protein EC90111_3119 [Escherichia coli 9.0111]KDV40059.1 membrane protein [Escherichia coli O146:H21 str. 2010C-3325]KDV63733.1 membrane protein [Escherichia coli O128:H2 str. 2011C-3317]